MIDAARAINDPLADTLYHAGLIERPPAEKASSYLKPLPYEIGPEYAAIHGQLCSEIAEDQRLRGDVGALAGAWRGLTEIDRTYSAEAAKSVAACLQKAKEALAACQERQAELRAKLSGLFAQWCKEGGTNPSWYVEN